MEQSVISVRELSTSTLEHIRFQIAKTHKWLRFLAIVSFVMAPLSVIAGFVNLAINPRLGVFQIFSNLISAAINIVLAVFMLQASTRGREYTDVGDPEALIAYNDKLRIYFLVSGIILIVILGLVVIGLLVAIIAGAAAWSMFM